MSRASGTLGGAASGAAAGAALGPWGAAAGGVIGGLAGYFGSGDDDDVQKAQEAKLAAGREAAKEYLAYRDVSNEAHMKAMANQQSYFDMNSSMMNSMNGGQGSPDIAGGNYQSVIQGEGMKPLDIANTTPQYGAQPMPEQNAPQPLSYVPRAQ
jgi:hypothetical protein